MKAALAILIVVFSVVLTEAGRQQFAQKLCRTEEDCDWDQCCIDALTRIPGFHGICHNPTGRGEYCNPDPNDRTEEGRYKEACPCDKGLNCKAKEEIIGGKTSDFHVCG